MRLRCIAWVPVCRCNDILGVGREESASSAVINDTTAKVVNGDNCLSTTSTKIWHDLADQFLWEIAEICSTRSKTAMRAVERLTEDGPAERVEVGMENVGYLFGRLRGEDRQ